MKKNQINIILLVCALSLYGCGNIPKSFIPLPDEIHNDINSTNVYHQECADKIKADIERSYVAERVGGGLLLALVDCAVESYREGRANNALKDFQKEYELFKFKEKINTRIEEILKNTGWLHIRDINHMKVINTENVKEILHKNESDCILISKFIYTLNPDFSVLTGTFYLTLYPASERMKKIFKVEKIEEKPIFKFHLSATKSLSPNLKDIHKNAMAWTQDNGTYLRKAMEDISLNIFSNLEKTLKEPGHLPED